MTTGSPTHRTAQPTTSEAITQRVVAMCHNAEDARLAQVLAAVVRHLHALVREVGLQPDELFRTAEFLTRCGQISDETRHEFLLLSDTLGLTMVVDTETSGVADGGFESSVLGPFYREGAPWVQHGESLSRGGPQDGEPVHVCGRVVDLERTPVAGAVLDVWGTNATGQYENVDAAQPDMNLRGRLACREDGSFDFWTAKPTSYPIPADGPAGELLHRLGRHNMRPAHLHVIASAPGFRTVASELFTEGDPFLDSDVVFGVKPSLVVPYARVDDPQQASELGVSNPFWTMTYEVVLTPGTATSVAFSTGAAL